MVCPRVGEVDEPAVIATVLEALRASSLGTAIGGGLLGAAGALRVRRAEPTLTARGKLVPLHLARGAATARNRASGASGRRDPGVYTRSRRLRGALLSSFAACGAANR